MNDVTQIIAAFLDRIKANNPKLFTVISIIAAVAVSLVSYYGWGENNLIVVLIIGAVQSYFNLKGPRTFESLSDSHPKKIEVKAMIEKEARKLKE